MDIELPPDFKEFLKLLHAHNVRYLLIGGYAVSYHGYPRTTDDLDTWVSREPVNAQHLVDALVEFGFGTTNLSVGAFLREKSLVQMGIEPTLIEIQTTISGVDFEECYARRVIAKMDGVEVSLIDLEGLKANKKASGRYKDLNDLEHLP